MRAGSFLASQTASAIQNTKNAPTIGLMTIPSNQSGTAETSEVPAILAHEARR